MLFIFVFIDCPDHCRLQDASAKTVFLVDRNISMSAWPTWLFCVQAYTCSLPQRWKYGCSVPAGCQESTGKTVQFNFFVVFWRVSAEVMVALWVLLVTFFSEDFWFLTNCLVWGNLEGLGCKSAPLPSEWVNAWMPYQKLKTVLLFSR